MRALPVDDKDWRNEHISYISSAYNFPRSKFVIKLKNLYLIPECSDLDLNFIANKGLKGKRLVFQDENGELFVHKIQRDTIWELGTDLTYVCIPHDIVRFDVVTRSIYKVCGWHSQKSSIIDFYLDTMFDLTKIHKSNLHVLREYASDLIEVNEDGINCGSVIRDVIVEQSRNDNVLEDNLNELIFEKYIHLDIFKVTPENENLIMVKYILCTQDSKFSGLFSISRMKFDANLPRRIFDGFCVNINMADSEYEDNLKYVKANCKGVKKIVKLILDNHRMSKNYAKFMKMYSLVLTRDNVLVAQFCFKDGLEKLIMEDELS